MPPKRAQRFKSGSGWRPDPHPSLLPAVLTPAPPLRARTNAHSLRTVILLQEYPSEFTVYEASELQVSALQTVPSLSHIPRPVVDQPSGHDGTQPRLVQKRGLIPHLKESAEDTDLEAEVLPPRANSNSVPLSLSMLLEDDCMDGLRTLVSQMIGRDSAYMCLGSDHLVVDFALIVRRYRREGSMAVRDGPAT